MKKFNEKYLCNKTCGTCTNSPLLKSLCPKKEKNSEIPYILTSFQRKTYESEGTYNSTTYNAYIFITTILCLMRAIFFILFLTYMINKNISLKYGYYTKINIIPILSIYYNREVYACRYIISIY